MEIFEVLRNWVCKTSSTYSRSFAPTRSVNCTEKISSVPSIA